MLVHIGQPDIAELVHSAWLRTIEDGVHTYDIFKKGTSKGKVGTKEFANAVVSRLGQKPFGQKLEQLNGDGVKFTSLSNRGVKVYPQGFEETFCTDHWRAGFMSEQTGGPVTHSQIVGLLNRVQQAGVDLIKIENLYTFDGQKGYVASQGE